MCVTFEEFFRRSLNWIGIEIRNFLHIFSTFGFAASSNIRQQEENIYFYIVGIEKRIMYFKLVCNFIICDYLICDSTL